MTHAAAKTDAELIAAAGTDAGAFRVLYDRHVERIHRFHLGRTRDREAAHDLTAETFAQAWLSRARFRDLAGGSAAPWLYGIARNLLVASVRSRRLEQSARDRLGVLGDVDRAEAAPEPTELWLEGLDEALAELAPELKQAIGLRLVHDLSYAELADAVGTTPGAARVRVHRGLAALRARLLKPKEATR
jgi:RNA polymerase sigma-70 factor, ECF subfamily